MLPVPYRDTESPVMGVQVTPIAPSLAGSSTVLQRPEFNRRTCTRTNVDSSWLGDQVEKHRNGGSPFVL